MASLFSQFLPRSRPKKFQLKAKIAEIEQELAELGNDELGEDGSYENDSDSDTESRSLLWDSNEDPDPTPLDGSNYDDEAYRTFIGEGEPADSLSTSRFPVSAYIFMAALAMAVVALVVWSQVLEKKPSDAPSHWHKSREGTGSGNRAPWMTGDG